MIAPNEKPEPKLTSKDIHAVLCICVKLCKGVAIPEEVLKRNCGKLKASYDSTNKVWFFDILTKPKRGIIKPKRKIILSN